jgi:hypothetical protein
MVLDHDDVLWIGWERYARQCPLHEHAAALRHPSSRLSATGDQIFWYADPSGATEINELRAANLKVARGNNDIRLGVMAVTARVRTGRLKVLAPSCPNLVGESQLYRYPTPQERAVEGENPVDENNHALGALRYLISMLDRRFIARLKERSKKQGEPIEPLQDKPMDLEETARSVFGAHNPEKWLSVDNEQLWS